MVSICAAVILIAARAMAAPAPDQAVSAEDHARFISAFVERQRATTTYRAELHQVLDLAGLREPVQSAGHVYFRAPDALALTFTQPAGEYIILNGAEVYVKKSNRPLRRQRIDPTRGRSPSGGDMRFLLELFQNGATNTLAHYDAVMTKTAAELLVTLTPKQPRPRSREPVRIENWISLPDLELRQMRVQFENQNAITYRFIDPVRDEPLDGQVFEPRAEDRRLP